MKRVSSVLFLAVILSSSAACRNAVSEINGTYRGDLSVIEGGVSKTTRVVTTIREDQKDGDEVTIQLMYAQNPSAALATIHVEKDGDDLELTTQLLPGISKVQLRDRGACASGTKADNKDALVTFCATGSVLSLFAGDATGKNRMFMYLSKNDSQAGDSVVKDGVYGLEDLYRRVKSSSYDTRLGVERLYQANEEIRLQRSKLIPGISVGTVLSVVDGLSGVLSIATTLAGNLMPFIFPSQWYMLDRSKALYEAEVFSYRTLVANQMNLVEGLYYGILRDMFYLAKRKEMSPYLAKQYQEMVIREQMGLVRPGTSLTFRNFILQNDGDIRVLENMIRTQYAILSRGVGLSPRNGIKALKVSAIPNLDIAGSVNNDAITARVLSQSLELKQLYYMERAAALQKTATSWSFINPSSWVGFSVSILHEVSLAKSKIREVQLLRQNTENTIEEQVINVSDERNALIDRNRLVVEAIQNSRSMLEQMDGDVAAGADVDVSALRGALESLFSLEAIKAGLDAAYAVNEGKYNRMLMDGPYRAILNLQHPKL